MVQDDNRFRTFYMYTLSPCVFTSLGRQALLVAGFPITGSALRV